MRSGRLSWTTFNRYEERRARNRLRDAWKKSPWLPGSTIDLRVDEPTFVEDVRHWLGNLADLSPATLDKLRWKFRQYRGGDGWLKFVSQHGRRLVNEIAQGYRTPQEVLVTPPAPAAALTPIAQPNSPPDSATIAASVEQSRDAVAPLLALCLTKDERDQRVAALVDYVTDPTSVTRKRWLDYAAFLRGRA